MGNWFSTVDATNRTLRREEIGKSTAKTHCISRPTSGRKEENDSLPLEETTLSEKIYPAHGDWGLPPIADAELGKVHLRVSHCSECTLRNLLKAGRRVLNPSEITRFLRSCVCKGVVGRVTRPKESGWMGKFNGEILGIDVVYPFVGVRQGVTGKNYVASLIVDCLPRFAMCSLIADAPSVTLINILVNDWIRALGKPRRPIMDHGPPGMFGGEWGDFPHTYAIQLVHAPQGAPYQNGLCERVDRSLKKALNAIMAEDRAQPSHRILTHAVMARNHVPHTATGVPPALAMAGRCDFLSEHAATAGSHDPESADPAVAQAGKMRNILNPRPAVLRADANRGLTTCIYRNLPNRTPHFYPLGSTVHITTKGQWDGSWNVIAMRQLICFRSAAGNCRIGARKNAD